MKKFLLATVTAAALSFAAAAQASLLEIEQGVRFNTPAFGGAVPLNQVFDATSGYVGAQLRSTAAVELTYTYKGKEAGWTNQFLIDGITRFVTGPLQTGVGTTWTTTAAAGELIDFAFRAGTQAGGINELITNIATNVNQPSDFFLGAVGGPFVALGDAAQRTGTTFWIALDDGGAGPNDNHDDLVVQVTARLLPVPEPATLALFGAGLLGLGLARRRRAA